MSDDIDAQRAEWEAFEAKSLRKRECPYSGELLTRHGEAGPHSLSCILCDCFGYDPNDKRIGT